MKVHKSLLNGNIIQVILRLILLNPSMKNIVSLVVLPFGLELTFKVMAIIRN